MPFDVEMGFGGVGWGGVAVMMFTSTSTDSNYSNVEVGSASMCFVLAVHTLLSRFSSVFYMPMVVFLVCTFWWHLLLWLHYFNTLLLACSRCTIDPVFSCTTDPRPL